MVHDINAVASSYGQDGHNGTGDCCSTKLSLDGLSCELSYNVLALFFEFYEHFREKKESSCEELLSTSNEHLMPIIEISRWWQILQRFLETNPNKIWRTLLLEFGGNNVKKKWYRWHYKNEN